jgi:WD40 repeat protein
MAIFKYTSLQFLCITLLLFQSFEASHAQSTKIETALQRGHSEAIKTLAFHPNGKYIFSAGRDKSIIMWQLSTGRQIRTFLGHTSTINCLAISLDGNTMVSGGSDNKAIVWDINTGEIVHQFSEHQERITSVCFHPSEKKILSAGYDDSVYVWNPYNGIIEKTFPANPDKGMGYGTHICFAPTGNILAIDGDNKTTTIWDYQKNKLLQQLRFHKEGWSGGYANHTIFNQNNIFMASNSEGVYRWNTEKWLSEYTFSTDDDECKNLSLNTEMLLGCFEKEIKIWDIKTGKKLYSIKNDSLGLNAAIFSPDGSIFAVAGDDKKIEIYQSKTFQKTQVLKGILNETNHYGLNLDYKNRWEYYLASYIAHKNHFSLSHNGQWLAKGKSNAHAILVNFTNGKIIREFKGHEKVVLFTQFSPDDKWLLTVSADHTAKLWEVASGKLIRTFSGHRELLFEARFSNDMKSIITSSWDASVKLWDINTGKVIENFSFENGSAYSLAFTPNDAYMAIAGLDKTLKLVELDSKQVVRDFKGHTEIVQYLAMHPNKPIFASAGWDGKARVWDINSGLQLYKITSHTDKVGAVAFNQLGTILATGSDDRSIKLWESNTGKEISTLKGHSSAVSHIEFSPDKKHLISQSIDGIIKIWDLNNYKEKASYFTFGNKDWLVSSPDGYFDATEKVKEYIYFIRGNESFSLDQFFDDFYKPRLLQKILSFDDHDLKQNLIEKIEKYPPPHIEFKNTANNEKTTLAEYVMSIKVLDTGGGIDEVRFTHNGKRISNSKQGLDRAAKAGNSITLNFSLLLQSGLNHIEVSAYSKGRVESKLYAKNIFLSSNDRSANCYVFAIGINQYKNQSLSLNYAQADAKEFTESMLHHTKKLFNEVHTQILLDENATKENIMDQLLQYTRLIKPEDVFIFYYAGHGSMMNDKFYFIPTDATRLYEEETLQKEAIYSGEMQEILQNIKALKQVMILDACHSGASAEMLALRGGGEEKAIAQLSRSAGIHILASAGSEQTAGEFKTLGHGIFTYALLQAIAGEADGIPKDGKITVYELKSFLDDKVPELTYQYKNTTQYPHTFSRGNDFPIVLKEELKK